MSEIVGNIPAKQTIAGAIGTVYGKDGLSAYEIALKEGFAGTEEEWLDSLKGDPGYTPQRGVDYWTEADKEEIKDYVDEQIGAGSGGGGEAPGTAVLYTKQSLTDEQKTQARGNIGAADNDRLNDVYNLLEIKISKNILDPANSESGYYEGTAGQPVTKKSTSNHLRTVNPIPVEAGQKLYVRTNLALEPILVFVVMYLAEDKTFISQSVANTSWGSAPITWTVPTGAKFVHFWIDGVNRGVSFENWCVSFESLDEFEPYSPDGTIAGIKPEALPLELFDDDRPIARKTIVNFGDSIFGKRRPPDDISTELARLTGATVHNCGFGGCRMAKHSMTNYDAFSMYRLADAIVSGDWSLQDAGIADRSQAEAVPSYFTEGLAILKGLDFANVDIITIAYGTNDFTSSVGMENADNAKDTTKFAGALRYSVETLLNAYPHLKIFVCSQTYRFWMDESNVFTEDSDTKVLGGVKLTDFVTKTEEVAKEYHLPYINNYDIGMDKYNRSYYFGATDGTHPLTTGCHLIAQHIAKELF